MQYLSARYEKGKVALQNFMDRRHIMSQRKNIVLAHGSIVEKQAELGPSTLLSRHCLL